MFPAHPPRTVADGKLVNQSVLLGHGAEEGRHVQFAAEPAQRAGRAVLHDAEQRQVLRNGVRAIQDSDRGFQGEPGKSLVEACDLAALAVGTDMTVRTARPRMTAGAPPDGPGQVARRETLA